VRHAIHLHYYEGLSIADTAEVLEVATSTIKYRLRQGLEQLRQRVAQASSPLRER
jgi:DNA-directed RNA polymerase specialized sigma24 family protein